MSTPLRPAQHGAVLAGIKATPSRWPPASLDPGCGRRTRRQPGARPREKIRQIQVSTASGDCRRIFRVWVVDGFAVAVPGQEIWRGRSVGLLIKE
jgi:hypothetical protein